ncbi:hypothetical protein OYC64_011968 [Pagothenia borchgrevinki]|uniref:Uncharacterized protein n=1 Tax=Pagothenia borchgrevinki TaxID=8213 RepID=A0ABD2FHF3_PAGBO
MPPALRLSADPDRGLGFGFLLGYDYERKKKKLQQELQLDYKQYAAKKKDLKTEPRAQPQGLSLPIHEKISVQEKLREERKREYNLFLQEKAQTGRLRRGTPAAKPEQVPASDAVYNIINNLKNTHSPPTVNTYAATLTEDGEKDGESARSRGRRRWRVQRPKKPLYLYSSEEEEEEEEAITELEVELEERRRKHRANRAPREIKEVKDPDVKDHNNNDWRRMSE